MRFACWLSLIALCACNAVLGIEDLKVKPDAGTSGPVEQREESAKSSPDAGEVATKSTDAGADAAARERTRTPSAGAAAPKTERAADAGTSQPAAAGSAGSAPVKMTADVPADVSSPITGTIIDYRGRKLPGVSVRVGDQQTSTDAAGTFTLNAVPSRYDVTLLIQTTIRNGAANLVWQFQGLSRRDPTLQVYRGLPERFGEVMIHTDNVTFPLASGQTILVGWSSRDGDFALETDSADVHYLSPMWSGPVMSTGTAHAFLISTANGVPSEYLAHDAQSVLMTADMTGQATFDLGGAKPTTADIQGTVSGPALGDRRNEVFLRFRDDDTALQLVNQWGAVDSFKYSVPSLPDAKLTVVAKSVINRSAMAAAYAEVEPGGPALALELPALPTLAAPDDNKTNIDGNSEFQWNSDAHVFTLCARAIDTYDSICVVTQAKQTRLPIGAAVGYTPPANAAFEWSVEVHDAYPSIDDATAEAGYLSAYGTDTIRGPRRGAGRFAQSVPRVFTTPP